ncbi:MAG: HAD hydrolase-like protein [Desulfobacterales bacterium]
MRFRAAIFDLDGTLLDTLEDLAGAMNRVLRRHGLPAHPVSAYRGFIGEGIEALVRRALPRPLPPPDALAARVREMREEYDRRCLERTRPFPGVRELLSACRGAGMELAVLTNKPEEAARRLLECLLPGEGFGVVCGALPGRPRKPDPAGARELLAALGVAPGQAFLLGDSAVDMQAAAAAGLYPVGALWGYRGAEELLEAGARLLCPAPADLIPWVS